MRHGPSGAREMQHDKRTHQSRMDRAIRRFWRFDVARTYTELLGEVRSKVESVSLDEIKRRIEVGEGYVLVDVREKDEWREGHLPSAIHLPRGFLEMQAESKLPDRSAKLIVYCAGGIRSVFAAATLKELGYEYVESADPGFVRWKDLGYPIEKPANLTSNQLDRYSRQILLSEVGEEGQKRLLESRVLLLGSGGLRSSAALYLAAAGVGTMGFAHHDTAGDEQESAIQISNPDVNVMVFHEPLTHPHVDRILDQKWDVVIDGLDDFATRSLVNDASMFRGLPVVHGSIVQFEGKVTTFIPGRGPCLRCLEPQSPIEPAPNHMEERVLLGIIGTIQATEAIKIILGKGEPLVGRWLTYDSMKNAFRTLELRRDSNCTVCRESSSIQKKEPM